MAGCMAVCGCEIRFGEAEAGCGQDFHIARDSQVRGCDFGVRHCR